MDENCAGSNGTHIAPFLIVTPFQVRLPLTGINIIRSTGIKMKSRLTSIFVALGMCLALAVGIQAKTPKTSGTGSQMTLTGCVRQGDQPNTFTLNNASSTQTSKKKSGKTPSEMARSEDTTFNLVPEGSNINLQQFIGQRVRVSGYMQGQQSTENTSESSSMTNNQFTVTSIHKTSGTCQK
jgi:hypothetical protein